MQRRFALTRIDRYILGQLSLGLVLVTVALVALIWLTQSLRFIQIIINRGLSPVVFVKLTLLLVPSFVATILPITCFIVVLLVYARLSGDRELTVMRAAGMSDLRLARPALLLAAGVMLFCYFLNIILVPASLSAFRNYQFEIRNQIAAFLLEPGVFTPVASGPCHGLCAIARLRMTACKAFSSRMAGRPHRARHHPRPLRPADGQRPGPGRAAGERLARTDRPAKPAGWTC